MKKLWVIDNGHGGFIDGIYQTPGKRSPLWDEEIDCRTDQEKHDSGIQYFEGVGNRQIANLILTKAANYRLDVVLLVPENEDISITERCKRYNRIFRKNPNAVLLSLHSNGSKKEQANGWEIWTSPGQTLSDPIATTIYRSANKTLGGIMKFRSDNWSDGDPDKEAKFGLLTGTKGPALLVENGFHTNKKECELLLSVQGRQLMAKTMLKAMVAVDKHRRL